jgi:hypothetical protein
MSTIGSHNAKSRTQVILYRISTGVIVLQTAAAAVLDLSREPGFAQVMSELGYPLYLMTILGVWRVLAIIALVIPGRPLLKEWTYAGLFFSFTGAAASHLVMNNPSQAAYPIAFAVVLLVSWRFRRASIGFFSKQNSE